VRLGQTLLVTTLLLTLALLLALRPAPASADDEMTARFTLVVVSGTHMMGQDSNGRGGLARIAGAVDAERARGGHVFVVHAGDAISPSLMSGLDHGAHMIDLLNMVDLDMFVPGSHEFDFGPEVFAERMAQARFPIYAANLKAPDGSTLPGIMGYSIINAGGLRIGIAGLTGHDAAQRSSPGALRFDDTLETAGRLDAALRKAGADVVVLVAHTPRAIDEQLRAHSGADVILSGDDHDLFIGYDGRTAFAEAMQDGLYLVAVDLDVSVTINGENARRVNWWPSFRLIDTAEVAPDAEVASRVALYEATIAKDLEERIAITRSQLDSRTPEVRGGEAAIGNLVADAVRSGTGADVALVNGGNLRGNRVYPPGSAITRRDVHTELPFGNKAVVLDIAGSDLKAALEQSLAGAERATGAFPQVSGLEIRADVTRPLGERVVSVMVNGEPLLEEARYKLATSDFLARGGDGLEALERARVLVGPKEAAPVADHVIDYLGSQGTVAPALEGRIVMTRSMSER
jgi:2',3'-cyclic-nucleotide 2'-phosphodiesterase (5'-nucleotidase family)